MPSGLDHSEQKWFKGWYEVVIKQAVIEAGYEPILAAAEEQPGAINDEIRTHLALDPMIVVDLGGAEPEDDPNPNVMYELGIRHALGLPLVMMAWKGQRLPFDVGNQRVIMEDRDLIDLELNRKKLVSFIQAAKQGRYYRPMDAVSRLATIQAASESLGEDSLLRALAQEVRDLRITLTPTAHYRGQRRRKEVIPTINTMLQGKVFRKELYPHFVEHGGNTTTWAKFLRTPVPQDAFGQFQNWTVEEWKEYIAARAKETLVGVSKTIPDDLDLEILFAIREMLPAQPWPDGIHREIAEKLGISNKIVNKYIDELIRRGEFMQQIDGQLFPAGENGMPVETVDPPMDESK